MKIHTKRALTLILAMMVLATCLAACGGAPDSSSAPPTPSTTTTTSSQADTDYTTHTPTGPTTQTGGKNESQDRSPQSNASTTTAAVANKGGAELLSKLEQIRSAWTKQQVYDLLGQPDRYGDLSYVSEAIYTVDDTTEARIEFWGWGRGGTIAYLYSTNGGKRRPVHAPVKGQELLDRLKQIQPDWIHEQVIDLLGMYERVGENFYLQEAIYTVDDTTDAVIAFRDEGLEIYLRNTKTQQTSPLPK